MSDPIISTVEMASPPWYTPKNLISYAFLVLFGWGFIRGCDSGERLKRIEEAQNQQQKDTREIRVKLESLHP